MNCYTPNRCRPWPIFYVCFTMTTTFNCQVVLGASGKKIAAQPWPMPQRFDVMRHVEGLACNFEFTVISNDCHILQLALSRYHKIILPHAHSGAKHPTKYSAENNHGVKENHTDVLHELVIDLTEECEEFPYLGVDEAYELKIQASEAILTSKSIWGILRGLETFSQMVFEDTDGTRKVHNVLIHDSPKFKHRGIMLDTARHFLPRQVLLANLDAMAYNKFNVFHWHIVDDQSFPYDSITFPQLAKKGSYQPHTHVYSQKDIADIIEYARLRGIRVVPEFDSPGHTRSWGQGQPNLLTQCYSSNGHTNAYGPIDPSKNSTYKFLESFVGEIADVFEDDYIHLGGDQTSYFCWQSNPDIIKFMEHMAFDSDYSQLERYYLEKLLKIAQYSGLGGIVWQEVFDNKVKLNHDTIVQVWKANFEKEILKITRAGHYAILSAPWYLDKISYGADWKKFYDVSFSKFPDDSELRKYILGGEACLWSEFVDATNVLSRLWPRASAVGEKLWSSLEARSDHVASRLDAHRCRMVARGVPAAPANGPGYCQHEYVIDN